MNKRYLEILLHTLGLSDPFLHRPYRNYFVAGDGHEDLETILEMCAEELMEETRAPGFLEKGDRVFRVTAKGEALAQKERPKVSRAQRRYHNYLNAADAFQELTFREYLTAPEWAESRNRS